MTNGWNLTRLSSKQIVLFGLLLILAFSPFLLIGRASAGTLTETFVRTDRIQINTQTTGTVCATQTTAGTDTTMQVTFPTGYTLGTAANFTVSTTNNAWPAGAAAWPGIATATNVTGQVVTFPSTTLTIATLYCFNWTNNLAVKTAAATSSANTGTVATYASGPTLIDSGSYALPTVTGDQISVTASVPQAFSFALSGTTDPLGTLSIAAVTSSPTPRTITINTNAGNGWLVWAEDANVGLNSASKSYTIGSTTPGANSTETAGTTGYNMGVTSTQTSGSGTITVAVPFVGGTVGRGGGLNTSLATVASSTGTAGNAVLTLTNNAAISSIVPPANDYADTITVTGAGAF